jgi:hypothetical protein
MNTRRSNQCSILSRDAYSNGNILLKCDSIPFLLFFLVVSATAIDPWTDIDFEAFDQAYEMYKQDKLMALDHLHGISEAEAKDKCILWCEGYTWPHNGTVIEPCTSSIHDFQRGDKALRRCVDGRLCRLDKPRSRVPPGRASLYSYYEIPSGPTDCDWQQINSLTLFSPVLVPA